MKADNIGKDCVKNVKLNECVKKSYINTNRRGPGGVKVIDAPWRLEREKPKTRNYASSRDTNTNTEQRKPKNNQQTETDQVKSVDNERIDESNQAALHYGYQNDRRNLVRIHKESNKSNEDYDENGIKLQMNPSKTYTDLSSQSNSPELPNIDYSVELASTRNKTLGMIMDEKLIAQLEQKAQIDPKLTVNLVETDSGNYFIDYGSNKSKSSIKLHVKSTLGTLLLEMVKVDSINLQGNTEDDKENQPLEVIEVMKRKTKREEYEYPEILVDNLSPVLNADNVDVFIDKEIQTRQENRQKQDDLLVQTQELNQELLKLIEETVYKNHSEIKKIHACKGKLIETYKNDLISRFERKDNVIWVEVNTENGTSQNIEALIIKTQSGNVAIDVSKIKELGDILCKESPALLRKTPVGTYSIYIGYQAEEDSKAPNSVLRMTESGGVLLVVTEPILRSILNERRSYAGDELFKIKVGHSNVEKNVPAKLKMSPSFNYLFVLDKEFQKQQLDNLNSCFDKNNECFVELRKTDSNISIHFEESCKKNAVILKTPSGNLKVLVNGPVFENLSEKLLQTNHENSHLEDLFHKIRPVNDYDGKRLTIKRSKIPNIKSSSDSNFLKKETINFLTVRPANLKKTSSGKFAAILDKESKRTFVNHLQKYLEESPDGLIPIKRTDSGEITIVLNADEESRFGTLKISSSGNIYVVVDENVIQSMMENEEKEKLKIKIDSGSMNVLAGSSSLLKSQNSDQKSYSKPLSDLKLGLFGVGQVDSVDTGSDHIIKKIIHPEDKTTTTACSSTPADCLCEPMKCVCDYLKTHIQSAIEKKMDTEPCVNNVKRKLPKGVGRKTCDAHERRTSGADNKKALNHSKDGKSEHKEQCFYTSQTPCFYKHGYQNLSNEIIPISANCNNKLPDDSTRSIKRIVIKPMYMSKEADDTSSDDWESFPELPPQSSPFFGFRNYR